MKKLLLLSLLLLMFSLSYSMNSEREKKLQQQEKQLDGMLFEAQAMNAGMKDMSRKLGVSVDQGRQEKKSGVAAKKSGGKLASLNASTERFKNATQAMNEKKESKEENERAKRFEQQEETLDSMLIEARAQKVAAQQMANKISQQQAASDKRISEDSKRIVDTFDQDFRALKLGRKNPNNLNASTKIYNYVRDAWIVELFFGVRLQTKLNRAFGHELSELEVSLERVENYLKKSPRDNLLIAQKELVEKEIQSFQKIENRDAFYRSSMKKSEFDLFKQDQAARE